MDTLNIGDNAVTFHGQLVRLTTQERNLLAILVRMAGSVVSRDEIFDALYGDFDEIPERKILDVLVCKIRRKLGAIHEQHGIETFPGTGYGYRVGTQTDQERTLAKTFHHKMMRELDGATMRGKQIPQYVHHAMRQALRKSMMRGSPIGDDKELARRTLDELAKG